MNDIYKVLKYIKEYIEDPKVIKDPMLQKIYVGAAAKANKLSKKHGTHYVLYDPSKAKLAVVPKSNLKQEIKEKGLTKDTAVLYVAKGKKVSEVAPEGWEGTVKAMKKDGDVDNPWALAWWMKNKGYKSHKKEVKEWHTGKRKDRVKQAKNQSEVLGYKMVGEVEEPSWDLTKKADRGDNIGEQKLAEISSKVKREIQNIMKYDHIDDLADYIEKFKIDKKHWRVISHYFDNIRDEDMGIKPSGYADKSRKELQKVLFKVIKEGKLNEFNKAHFLNLIKQEIESLKGQIAYAKDKVRYKGTPDWEKKEFAAILKDKIKDLKDTEKHYKRVEKLKEGKLNEGKLTTTFYFDQSKYINKIRDILAKYKGGAKAFKFMGNSKPKHMVVGGHKMKMSGKKATMWNGIPNNKVKEAEKFFKSHGLKWLKTQQNFPNMRPIMKVEGRYRLSPQRDLEIHSGGSIAQVFGKNAVVALDKKSMKELVKLIRINMGLFEKLEKIMEGKTFRLSNGVKVEFLGKMQLKLTNYKGKKVILDVGELRQFLKGVKKDMGVRA